MNRLGIIGAGAWGTALARVAAEGGKETLLWARDPGLAQEINERHTNAAYLPGIGLPPTLRATCRLADLGECSALLVATPAQHVRSVLAATPAGAIPLVLCSKGIEAGSRALMSEVARTVHGRAPVAVLSGPTFAAEVALGLPTAVTLACSDEMLGRQLAERLASPSLRPYWTDDVIGAEVGGAVKNVLAIACGVVTGLRLGENARAAVISRGFAEMARFGLAKGARAATLAGLSGLGDLVLTCGSTTSRNMSLGVAIGQGRPAAALLAERRTVAEGAFTAPVLVEAARALGVEMPIAAAVVELLRGARPVGEVVHGLLNRPLRAEEL